MPDVPLIFVFSGAAVIVAVVGFILVHRLTKPIDLREHQSFLDAMLSIVGTLVSILLGLLVAAAMDRYQQLETSVDTEAASVAAVYRLSSGLPSEIRHRLRDLCRDYSDVVINEEWPEMAQGREDYKALGAYVKLVAITAKFKPSDNGETNLHSALLTAVTQIGDCRRQRILALHNNWSRHLMPMLIICSMIVLIFAYLYITRGAKLHAMIICLVAIALGGNLGLVFVLSNPFWGDWKIQPRSFVLNTKILKKVYSEPELHELLEF